MRAEGTAEARESGYKTTLQAVLLIFQDYGFSLARGMKYLSEWNKNCGKPHTERELWRQVERIAAKRATSVGRGDRRGGFAIRLVGPFGEELERAQRDITHYLGAGDGDDGWLNKPAFRSAREVFG